MDQDPNQQDDAVESTPLLIDETDTEDVDGADVEQRRRDELASAADARSAKIAFRLYVTALTIGIITLGLDLGILIVLGWGLTPPGYNEPWLIRRSAEDMIFPVCPPSFLSCPTRLPFLT
jgi:hypothetical protein